MDKEYNELWDLLIKQGIATEKELQLVTAINGQNVKTLNDVLYVRTGCRYLGQFKEEID